MELKEVFGPIINFIKSLQKKEHENSKIAAKERLKLVLMQDRASVSPDFFEMMKKEIIEVIKKYIEIDEETLEVQLTRGFEDGLEGPALYANIPIKSIKPVAKKPIEKKEEEQEEQVTEENTEESTKEENIDEVVSTLEETEKTEEKNEDLKETEEEILSEIYEEPKKVEETKEQKDTQKIEVKHENTNEKPRKKNKARR
jgi:cell division topological specificity factor